MPAALTSTPSFFTTSSAKAAPDSNRAAVSAMSFFMVSLLVVGGTCVNVRCVRFIPSSVEFIYIHPQEIYMNNKTRIAAACVAMLATTASYAQSPNKGDQDILKDLALANISEVAAGNIALQKSTTPA